MWEKYFRKMSIQMEKIKINVVTIGRVPIQFKLLELENWKSEIFEIVGVENYGLTGNSDRPKWRFSDEFFNNQLQKNFVGDFRFVIVNVPIRYNFYSRRISENCIVFTFHEIANFLFAENIPLQNVVLRLLYSYALLYQACDQKIPTSQQEYQFAHDETRGCLFDMNGIKSEIIESCNQPIICEECAVHLQRSRVPVSMIKAACGESRKIKKPLYYRLLDSVKTHPLLALFISSGFAILLGIAGSLAASFLYDAIRPPQRSTQHIP